MGFLTNSSICSFKPRTRILSENRPRISNQNLKISSRISLKNFPQTHSDSSPSFLQKLLQGFLKKFSRRFLWIIFMRFLPKLSKDSFVKSPIPSKIVPWFPSAITTGIRSENLPGFLPKTIPADSSEIIPRFFFFFLQGYKYSHKKIYRNFS